MQAERPRTVKLYCPSLSKIIQLAAWDEQRLDLGRIARAFGLDPSTLKLNGHFISRGVDLIASSVTWKSLLSFFSARGLSTGSTDSDALIVDGKLAKLGSKRAHEVEDVDNRSVVRNEHAPSFVNRRFQLEDSQVLNSKRLKDSNPGLIDKINHFAACSGQSLKRKFCVEDPNSLKRTRINASDLRKDDLPSTSPNRQLPCSIIVKEMKRTREDEMLLTAPSKRLR